ncbi:MAG: hypothetical protein JWN86_689 [Planctomycetota bacterium]|nr:hypothetical protein [Planctomycetota bacterium]
MRPITNVKRPTGFTLIELAIVILIIGLLMAFVLAAAAAGLESARVRATQALITKLNVGLEERLEALLSTQVPPNGAHRWLAAIPTTNLRDASGNLVDSYTPNPLPWGLQSDQRAQVLARIDQIKAEFPDIFFIDPNFASDGLYPIKFGGTPYNPNNEALAPNDRHYILPMGNSVFPPYIPDGRDAMGNALNGRGGFIVGITNPQGTGINGASYSAAASLYKLIGYTPRGYDGVDNNGDGFVDDVTEGQQNADGSTNVEAGYKIGTANDPSGVIPTGGFLGNHQHKTARSEMLYALLVEGLGPLGSVFSREDFRDTELRDTDNDGVLEFVDGWGEPLQFYRWPVWHRSGGEARSSGSVVNQPVLQKGDSAYGAFETRQQNALDPNGQLVALSWWCDNASFTTPSLNCTITQTLFGPLSDRFWQSSPPQPPPTWDRSGASPRRAYFTKFLILSSGPDRRPGVPMLTDSQIRGQTAAVTTLAILGSPNGPGENWAMLLDSSDALPSWRDPNNDPPPDSDFSFDDITNQDLQNRAGGFQ